ncbi:MAG: methyltransferase domain-containing protein [Candidatus Lokiarchaeota archaeon]|nr:methyltransferase domain-containing protein [Candidatus Lokiarchaeota archaeon]MBD3201171.1 methyltransferase domain-containing protein [Candidatus Lokiarchaeota archaeon]
MDKFAIANLVRNIILNIPKLDRIYLKLEGFLFNIEKSKRFKANAKAIIKRNLSIFNKLQERILGHIPDFTSQNKIILEIGPGSSLILAILFILKGAKQVILVDRYKQIYNNRFNQLLNQYFIKIYKHTTPNVSLSYDEVMNKITYYGYSGIENLYSIKKNQVDLIFSLSVLEHVQVLEKTIAMISYLLKPKGIFYSSVDLRDHFHIRDKCFLDFLKYPHNFWNLIGHTNRERFNTFNLLFKKYKFNIIELIRLKMGPIDKIDKIKDKFNSKFKNLSKEELSIRGFKILAQKF